MPNFLFNFSKEEGDCKEAPIEESTTANHLGEESTADNHKAQKTIVLKQNEKIDILHSKIPLFNLSKRLPHDAQFQMNSLKYDELNQINKQSDLLKGKYEGGMKTWECSFDLLAYFKKTNQISTIYPENNQVRILELGCGSALPSLYLLKENINQISSINVDFQDYNFEVLELITIPNCILNVFEKDSIIETEQISDDGVMQSTLDTTSLSNTPTLRFISGDWADLLTAKETATTTPNTLVFPLNTYDLIITSETLYNESSVESLFRLCKTRLRRVEGARILVATKVEYFGVNGGLQVLLKYWEKYNACDGVGNGMDLDVVEDLNCNGVRRVIVEIKWKKREK